MRHYHQIGLLPEPPRSAGGYRRYDVGHLVRLLRITRMTALGVPLSALPAVLDDPATAEELLDELVAQLEPVVARLAGLFSLDPRASTLMDELSEQTLKPVQHRVLREVQQRLARSDGT